MVCNPQRWAELVAAEPALAEEGHAAEDLELARVSPVVPAVRCRSRTPVGTQHLLSPLPHPADGCSPRLHRTAHRPLPWFPPRLDHRHKRRRWVSAATVAAAVLAAVPAALVAATASAMASEKAQPASAAASEEPVSAAAAASESPAGFRQLERPPHLT